MSKSGIDTSQITMLSKDLGRAVLLKPKEVRASLFKGGINIKARAREIIAGALSKKSAVPHYPSSITFAQEDRGMTVVVGPDNNKRQGPLGHFLEYGGVDQAPIPHLQPAFDEELPRAEAALSKIAGDIL